MGMMSDHTRAVKHFHPFERIPAHVLPNPAAAERKFERDILLGIFAANDEFNVILKYLKNWNAAKGNLLIYLLHLKLFCVKTLDR